MEEEEMIDNIDFNDESQVQNWKKASRDWIYWRLVGAQLDDKIWN